MDPNQEQSVSWKCENFNKAMNSNEGKSKSVKSNGGRITFEMANQKQQNVEFMKILSLAHMCEVEKFIDKDGK